MRTEPGSARAVAAAPEPVRCWQRVQWQYDADRNGRSTSNRTAPQPHLPVNATIVPSVLEGCALSHAPLERDAQSTGQFTTTGAGFTVTWPARTAAMTAFRERSARGVAPDFHVTICTAQSGV